MFSDFWFVISDFEPEDLTSLCASNVCCAHQTRIFRKSKFSGQDQSKPDHYNQNCFCKMSSTTSKSGSINIGDYYMVRRSDRSLRKLFSSDFGNMTLIKRLFLDLAEIIESRLSVKDPNINEYYVHYDGCKFILMDFYFVNMKNFITLPFLLVQPAFLWLPTVSFLHS